MKLAIDQGSTVTIKTPSRVFVSSFFVMVFPTQLFSFADCAVVPDPTAEQLAEIALQTAEKAEFFNIVPRIALISFSNFGSAPHPINDRILNALEIIHRKRPDLAVDGDFRHGLCRVVFE